MVKQIIWIGLTTYFYCFFSGNNLFSQQNIIFPFDGLNRTYHLYIPNNLPLNAPLVFVLHGYMQDNNWAQSNLSFDAIADTAGFVVCYPQGTTDILGFTHWNAGLNVSNTDDIGFLSALAIFLQNTYQLNPNCTFSCGFSNGGFMSYTMSCEVPEIFRAIGSVSGTMSGDTWENCNTTNVTPVLQFHGVDDGTIPIEGRGPDIFGWGGAPRIRTIVDFWSDKNNCSTLDSMQASLNAKTYFHRDGIGSNEVWYYEIENHGHVWPGTLQSGVTDNSGIHASSIIWDFFKQFCDKLTSKSDIFATTSNLHLQASPSSDMLVIKGALNEYVIEILNSNEELFEQLITSDDVLSYDLTNLPGGMHFIRLAHQNQFKLNFQNIIKSE
jgi:polyhydroxybutyrate depolymerase